MARIARLLIANRGEIACRIARTAHRMGIATAGVYAEPDRDALHTDTVDLAVAIPDYLDADAIVAAAHHTGADAVHPGYGFLAENAAFADAVIAAGLIWVGPTPDQIRVLGDKIAAKRAALAAGVPTTPIVAVTDGAWHGPLPPFPLLVKAAAGGGGRGMRVVASADELDEAIAAASRAARSAFGDGTVFIEPFIARGRHVEVQIFGDTHGNAVHLGERECSIQRRNQKIVEESPSPGITPETRAVLLDGAVALAQHVGYVGAGTVEFMVGEGADGRSVITFLEVNTRLQVEHPVTEAVTGLDLVEWQLRVAEGERLPLSQADITFEGVAIEVRLVAEDPAAGWLPSVGTLSHFDIAGDGIRVDTGFRAGSTVVAEYDSMLAKVIIHDATRADAAARLGRALRGAQIAGVRTNVGTLAAILGEPDFLAGDTPTAYLGEHPDVLIPAGLPDADEVAHLVAAVFATEAANQATNPLAFAPSGWRNLRTRGQRRARMRDGIERHIEYVVGRDGLTVDVLVGPPPQPGPDGAMTPDERCPATVRLLARTAARCVVELDGVRHAIGVDASGDTTVTSSPAGTLVWITPPRFADHDLAAEGAGPISPLPGTVIAVHVEPGQHVAEGDLLMVVEAMKMEHRITAAAAGVVAEVRFAAGDRVDQGDLLVVIDHPEDD